MELWRLPMVAFGSDELGMITGCSGFDDLRWWLSPYKGSSFFFVNFFFFFLNLWLFFLLQGMKWRMWIFKKIRWAFRIRPGPWLFGPEIGFGYYKFYIYDLFSSYFFGSLYFFSYLSWAKSHLSSTRFTKLYKYYLFYKDCFCVFVQASL